MQKTIRITCDTQLRIPFSQLHGIQKNLKEMSKESYEKLRKRIADRGINFAFHVWKELCPVLEVKGVDMGTKTVTVGTPEKAKDRTAVKWWIIDGHGRHQVIGKMLEDGYTLEDGIPCVEIEATNLKDAKQQVLAASSQFHKMTKQGLYEFMGDAELEMEDLSDFDLPMDMDKFEDEYFKEEETEEETEEEASGTFTKFTQECPKCGFTFEKKEGGE